MMHQVAKSATAIAVKLTVAMDMLIPEAPLPAVAVESAHRETDQNLNTAKRYQANAHKVPTGILLNPWSWQNHAQLSYNLGD